MSAHILQSFQSVESGVQKKQLAVSFRLLLSLYAVIPICLAIQLLDQWFLGGYLRTFLPTSPNSFVLFQILFGTPHIIASTLLMTTNTEYLNFYRRKILWMSFALAVFFGVGNIVLPYHFLYILVASWTVYHVLKQQHGVARGVCRLSDKQFYSQLWLGILAGIFVYIGIFMKNSLSSDQAEFVRYGAGFFCLALLVNTLLVHNAVVTRTGKLFLWANTLLVLSSFYLYSQQYYFLAILVPRLVHDATAYVFYVVHDVNRHAGQPRNFVYRAAKKIKVNVFLVLPVISFVLAYGLQQYGDALFNSLMQFLFGMEIRKAITVGLLGYFALMHYYTESFIWKNGSPYRKFILFSK